MLWRNSSNDKEHEPLYTSDASSGLLMIWSVDPAKAIENGTRESPKYSLTIDRSLHLDSRRLTYLAEVRSSSEFLRNGIKWPSAPKSLATRVGDPIVERMYRWLQILINSLLFSATQGDLDILTRYPIWKLIRSCRLEVREYCEGPNPL